MPYLKIQTNVPVAEDNAKILAAKASRQLAADLGKPERYVMVELTANLGMIFGGSGEPAAYLELKSIGLSTAQVKLLSQSLPTLLESAVGIPPSRIYIEFTDVNGSLWGWNGATF